jgi:hypothetical protein
MSKNLSFIAVVQKKYQKAIIRKVYLRKKSRLY